jgi:hypothetical protein
VQQLGWTSPFTNKLLFEAGFGTYISRWGGTPMPGQNPNLIRVVDQCTTGVAPGQPCEHGIANVTYRSPNWGSNWTTVYNWRGSASYTLGAHNMKVGLPGLAPRRQPDDFSNDQFLSYRFKQRRAEPVHPDDHRFTRHQWVRTAAFYGQDSVTYGRVTFQGALRYDHAWSFFPEQTIIPVRFFPVCQDVSSHAWLVVQRPDAARRCRDGSVRQRQDVVEVQLRTLSSKRLRTRDSSSPTTRSTIVDDRCRARGPTNNNDKVIDCNLQSQLAQSPATTGSIDTCGVGSPNFGTDVVSSTLDPTLTTGWGVRTGDWQWGLSLQQEIMPRVSAEVSYQHRWLLNFSATDNRAVASTDYDKFSVIIPTDPRLQDLGVSGTLDDVYNLTAAANARATDNFVTLAERYGSNSQTTNSISLNVTARPKFGLTMQGGFNWAARTTTRAKCARFCPRPT